MAASHRTTTSTDEKPLSKWLICAVCAQPLQAARGVADGADRDPLVTCIGLYDSAGVVSASLAHSACARGTTECHARSISIAQDKDATAVYGSPPYDDKFGALIAPFVSDDPRAVVTYVAPRNFIVSRTHPMTTRHVFECCKDPRVAVSLGYLALYRSRSSAPVASAHPTIRIHTRAFSSRGEMEVLHLARAKVSWPVPDAPLPLTPAGFELVFFDYTPRLSADGKELAVGATRVQVERSHVFVVVNRGKMFVFIKPVGAGKRVAVKPQCMLVTDLDDTAPMRRAHEDDGYECSEL